MKSKTDRAMWEVRYKVGEKYGMMLVCVEKSTDEIPSIMEKAGIVGAEILKVDIPFPMRSMMKQAATK